MIASIPETNAWAEANPELATELTNAVEDNVPSPEEMFKTIPEQGSEAEATRVSGNKIIQEISKAVPHYISGSADLHGSCRNYIEDGGNYGAGFDKSYSGKNLYFGIREHAMGSIMNGFAYHGLFKVSGSTFAVFVDYFRPTIRVAALAELNRVSYILTHDSIGVGEDGPTHQPVETVSGLRVFPNLDVWRPSDAEETVAAFVSSVTHEEGPTALIFSRQTSTKMLLLTTWSVVKEHSRELMSLRKKLKISTSSFLLLDLRYSMQSRLQQTCLELVLSRCHV